jgi:hypothetical protein
VAFLAEISCVALHNVRGADLSGHMSARTADLASSWTLGSNAAVVTPASASQAASKLANSKVVVTFEQFASSVEEMHHSLACLARAGACSMVANLAAAAKPSAGVEFAPVDRGAEVRGATPSLQRGLRMTAMVSDDPARRRLGGSRRAAFEVAPLASLRPFDSNRQHHAYGGCQQHHHR